MVIALTCSEAEKQIAGGRLAPFYLLAGEETYLKRLFLDAVRRAVLTAGTADLNYSVFSSGETALRDALDMARTRPVFGERRIVVLRSVEKYASQDKLLVGFLEHPIAHLCLVLDTDKTLRDKFVQRLARPAVVCVTAERLEGRQLQHWISMFVRKEGKKITPAAVEALLARSEPDLEFLARGLRTVCQFKQAADLIHAEDIEAVVGKTRTDSRFVLLNELMERRADRALGIATELSQDGRQVTDLIGLINWQIRQMKSFLGLAREGLSPAQIGKALNISQYALRRVRQYAERFSAGELERGARLLLDADTAIKKGLKSPVLALQTFIVEFCGRVPVVRR